MTGLDHREPDNDNSAPPAPFCLALRDPLVAVLQHLLPLRQPARGAGTQGAVGSFSLAGTRLSCTMTVQLLSNESSPFFLLDFHLHL